MADSPADCAGQSSWPRVALALGSGGARGYAHIEVIDIGRTLAAHALDTLDTAPAERAD